MADIERAVAELLGTQVVGATPVGGGDVADAFRVVLGDGTPVFAKAHRTAPPGFFATEAVGLAWLRDAGAAPVPEVLAVSEDPAVLVLEWIEPGRLQATERALGAVLGRSSR